jgi:hypothetical protein
MVNKIRNLIVTLASLSVVALPVAVPSAVLAANTNVNIGGSLCSGTNFDLANGSQNACDSTKGTNNLNELLKQIINYFSIIVGVIAVGGLRYITSGGESSKVGSAKTTIIYALVGLVVVALAQLIVHFVLGQANQLAG